MPEYISRSYVRKMAMLEMAYTMETKTDSAVVLRLIDDAPAADVAPVVRCRDCINAEPLERNCELNANLYMHCRLWRGEECKNVWHKYKRYYRDYSLVQQDDFCSCGAKMDGARNVEEKD